MLASLSSNQQVLATEPVIGFLKKLDILISLNLVLNVLKYSGLYAKKLQRGGGHTWGYIKKRGVQLQTASGRASEDNVKNLFL